MGNIEFERPAICTKRAPSQAIASAPLCFAANKLRFASILHISLTISRLSPVVCICHDITSAVATALGVTAELACFHLMMAFAADNANGTKGVDADVCDPQDLAGRIKEDPARFESMLR